MKLAVVEMIALAVLVAFTTFVDSEEVRFVSKDSALALPRRIGPF